VAPGSAPRRRAARRLPAARVASTYRREWLRDDLAAGLILTALLIPQGMAYGALAGLPPVTGLYATLVPLVVYALLGPSRILVVAPDSAIAPVVAALVVPMAGEDFGTRSALAAMLAVMVGLFMIFGAVARFGFLADLLSKPVRLGFLAGIAVLVVVSQLPELFGFAAGGDGLLDDICAFVGEIDRTDPTSLAVGAGVLAVVAALSRFGRRVPALLVAVGAATICVAVFDLRVTRAGALPQGLPPFALPDVSGDDIRALVLPAVAIALLAFADTSVLSRAYATRLGDRVDQDEELLALGAANVATGFFSGFPISTSATRTPVAETAGARSQLTGLVAAAALAGVLLFGNEIVRDLPLAALAAVVIWAVVGLVDVRALRRLARTDRTDFAFAIVSFLGVTILGVLPGIGLAVGISLAAFLWRAWHPYSATLGRVEGMKGYHDVSRHPDAELESGLLLMRFDAPLFFANAEVFRERVLQAVHEAVPQPTWLVVAAEPITDVDSSAADVLLGLVDELSAAGTTLVLAEAKGPVKDKLRRFGVLDRIGEAHVFPTVGAAVHGFARTAAAAPGTASPSA
jgi:high affinity sulfate transporter 1